MKDFIKRLGALIGNWLVDGFEVLLLGGALVLLGVLTGLFPLFTLVVAAVVAVVALVLLWRLGGKSFDETGDADAFAVAFLGASMLGLIAAAVLAFKWFA